MSLLAQIDDEEVLREMLKLCLNAFREADILDDLPPAVLADLQAAIAVSYDESDLMPNEIGSPMAKKWTKL